MIHTELGVSEFLLSSICLQKPKSAIIDEICSIGRSKIVVVSRHQVQVQVMIQVFSMIFQILVDLVDLVS